MLIRWLLGKSGAKLMAERCSYTVQLQVKSPFLFAGTVNTRIGVDVACLRDASGRPVVPDTQVRGVLRAALVTLSMATSLITDHEVGLLFGSSSDENATDGMQDIPKRGRAFFGDLASEERHSTAITRIAIDDDTGTVQTGALQVVELVAPYGEVVSFRGPLIIRYGDGLEMDRIEKALSAALKLIPAIGAFKSSGFGETIPGGALLTRTGPAKPLVPMVKSSLGGSKSCYELHFDRPILVDSERVTGNLFAGSTIVPGSVIKGALAETLKAAGLYPETDPDLSAALADLHVSHAFPTNGDHLCDLPIPKSLVFVTEPTIRLSDAICTDSGKGVVWKGPTRLAKFAASAKTREKALLREQELVPPVAKFNKIPRTHVEIDSGTWAAAQSALFTTVAVDPGEFRWRFTVDTCDISDNPSSALLLSVLENGLDGVGRTGASASVSPSPVDTSFEAFRPGDEAVFTLVTPALMFLRFDETQSIREHYGRYFRKAFDGASLVNFFATQRLNGGYIAVRRRVFGNTYYPFILTEAGSVFRVKLTTDKACIAFSKALRTGLPVGTDDAVEVNWRNCAYVPQNGYGQIAAGTQYWKSGRRENPEDVLSTVGGIDVR